MNDVNTFHPSFVGIEGSTRASEFLPLGKQECFEIIGTECEEFTEMDEISMGLTNYARFEVILRNFCFTP